MLRYISTIFYSLVKLPETDIAGDSPLGVRQTTQNDVSIIRSSTYQKTRWSTF